MKRETHRVELKLSVAIVLSTLLVACGTERADSDAASVAGGAAVDTLASAVASATAKPASAPRVAEPPLATATPIASGARVGPSAAIDVPIAVKRLVVARGVEHREPTEPIERVAAGEIDRVYAFVEVANPERAESEIHVSFVRDGAPERGSIELSVGASPRWRTWAYSRRASEPGKWSVVVRDAQGKELARTEFEVAAPRKPSAVSDQLSAS